MISKVFVTAAVVFTSSLSLAYPAIGDKVEYQGIYKSGAQAEKPINIKMEIKSFDAAKQEWIVQQDTTADGHTKTEMEDIDADEMITSEQVSYILANCTASGGVAEKVTVPAGTFDTCHLAQSSTEETQDTWIANVPFGFVKVVQHDLEDNEVLSVELQSFTAAQ